MNLKASPSISPRHLVGFCLLLIRFDSCPKGAIDVHYLYPLENCTFNSSRIIFGAFLVIML